MSADRLIRPCDPEWPSQAAWAQLSAAVDGRLVAVSVPSSDDLFEQLANPHFIAEHPGLTQTCGWADAWASAPSAYAVIPHSTGHVVAAVDFARKHNLRIVVKSGGHSYKGTSCAADSLLLWMKDLDAIDLQSNTVVVGGGTIWSAVYKRVTTENGRYVQGAGALTVSVAGLISAGGFGSFSRRFGLVASGLVEAEVVTADGVVRRASATSEPELFWALKGGGGGFGVITRATLQTHDLPNTFGTVSVRIDASSDSSFCELIRELFGFYAEGLFNAHWGERIIFGRDNSLDVNLAFQGLERQAVEARWNPWVERLAANRDWSVGEMKITCVPAAWFWNPAAQPHLFVRDGRPGAPDTNIAMTGDVRRAGQFIHGYRSVWLPADLLKLHRQRELADAVFACSRHWEVCFHFNKGLAAADPGAIALARDTAINPAVLGAFALARCSAEGPPAIPGWVGHEPNLNLARREAGQVHAAIDELLKLAPQASYVAESDFFESDWRQSFWGSHYPRLAAAKHRYDPSGLFCGHHFVSSEARS